MTADQEYKIVRDSLGGLQAYKSPTGSEGMSVNKLISRLDGSVHVEISVCSLAPGGFVRGHIHPFEESFYVLSGRVNIGIGESSHQLVENDFGFVPVSIPHAWSNPYDESATWYRVRAPQPRQIGATGPTIPIPGYEPPTAGSPIEELDPLSRYLGRFTENSLPPPGPLAMPGTHGHNIRDISVRMMVDDVLGAVHHQTFMVQFVPSDNPRFSGSPHFHAFEEAYFVLQGSGQVELEGEHFHIFAGDLVWQKTGVMHAWRAVGDAPLRFIELMAPRPPYTNMLFSYEIWNSLAGPDSKPERDGQPEE